MEEPWRPVWSSAGQPSIHSRRLHAIALTHTSSPWWPACTLQPPHLSTLRAINGDIWARHSCVGTFSASSRLTQLLCHPIPGCLHSPLSSTPPSLCVFVLSLGTLLPFPSQLLILHVSANILPSGSPLQTAKNWDNCQSVALCPVCTGQDHSWMALGDGP